MALLQKGMPLLRRWSGLQAFRQYSVPGICAPSPPNLDQVMKLDALLDKSGQEVCEIWQQYHSNDAVRVGTCMSTADYEKFVERSKKSPMFVLPVGKPGGFFTLVMQVQLPHVLFTSVEEFQRYGTGAPAQLFITHYKELMDSKGVVLVRGDVVNDKSLSANEARTLMELTRAFYVSDEDHEMVHNFNHNQAKFDFNELLKKLGIKVPNA